MCWFSYFPNLYFDTMHTHLANVMYVAVFNCKELILMPHEIHNILSESILGAACGPLVGLYIHGKFESVGFLKNMF